MSDPADPNSLSSPGGDPPGPDAEVVSFTPDTVKSEFAHHPKKHRDDTARRIAYVLVGVLAASIPLHYVVIWASTSAADATLRLEAYKAAFNALLPVVSGLVSAAATYYFTRESEDR